MKERKKNYRLIYISFTDAIMKISGNKHVKNKPSRECRKAPTTSQMLQISFVEIGDEHIFKLKIQKGI